MKVMLQSGRRPEPAPGGGCSRAAQNIGAIRGGRKSGDTGVALIITLILLSVITFMAVTFLVVSRSQRGAVSTTTDQTTAREAANTAQDRAIAEILASMVATTNPGNYGLFVSTNFISGAGFRPNVRSFTNVNYNYADGTAVRGDDLLLNLSQLLLNPRPPVYVTNRFAANSNEFRYYLDWNRNRRYDTNGYLPVMSPRNEFYDTNETEIPKPTPGMTLSNFFVGDPEWIGGLERSDLPHSSSNRFLFRYSYIVVPAGKTLDINYVHNYARGIDAQMLVNKGDGFTRNQGAGTFEINLAGFLTDLNTNAWPYPRNNGLGVPYFYDTSQNLTRPNTGTAFDDALAILRHRYTPNYQGSLFTLSRFFGNDIRALNAVKTDFIDDYAKGPIMTNATWNLGNVTFDPDSTRVDNVPWAASDNTNHFFSPQDFFDPAKTSLLFSNRLWRAGTNNDSYDRYTFYRLLSQMGTDTASEPQDKINLNYDNQVQGVLSGFTAPDGTQGLVRSVTNFIAWRPLDFFTNAANKLIENAGYNTKGGNWGEVLNVHHIQIYPTNLYTPSIHQMLQLAANIYDATTNQPLSATGPGYPSVFRPLFGVTNNVVFIRGYEEVTDFTRQLYNVPWRDLKAPGATNNLGSMGPNDMIWGVPVVIGAKKGYPNFNELAMQTSINVARKIEFLRAGGQNNGPISETNLMYTLSISNIFGTEAWNSYSNTFPPLQMAMHTEVDVYCDVTNLLNNGALEYVPLVSPFAQPAVKLSNILPIGPNSWPGNFSQASFKLPLSTNTFFLANSVYRDTQLPRFVPIRGTNVLGGSDFERLGGRFPVPHWFVKLRICVKFILVDAQNRVLDFVNLESEEDPLDLAAILSWGSNCGEPNANATYVPDGQDGSMWCTNRLRDPTGTNTTHPTFGMLNQMAIGLDLVQPANWNSFQAMYPTDKGGSIDFFRAQFDLSPHFYPGSIFTKTNRFYAPFVPMRRVNYVTEWQANDPLVHYTIGDLVELYGNFATNRINFLNTFATTNLGVINKRYEPWGGGYLANNAKTVTNMALKDPMVTRSDDWEFPTNKFPNVGWLGRVHRGTPWQTIDLKSPMLSFQKDQQDWQKWSGNGTFVRNFGQLNTNVVPFNSITNDAAFTHPINDRYILDLFTASINDNATRGQLAVTQTNLAAWSAVLSGVNVLPRVGTNTFAEPAGTYFKTNPPAVARIVNGIQNAMTNYPGHTFHRLGDILAVPELTVNSPFLQPTNRIRLREMTDAVYERLPQQILGLLKGPEEPRFVIYSFGQTLKPAVRSLVPNGPFSQLCTNYQVTAEVATRAVVRIDGAPVRPNPFLPPSSLTNLHAVVESFNVLPPE